MHKVELTLDPSTEKAAERRRSAEEARKARIFNTRQRVMGLDLEALNQQVTEKNRQESLRKQQDVALEKLRNYHHKVLLLKDTDEKEKQAAAQVDLAQYWLTNQRMEDSLDADLLFNQKRSHKLTIPESELGPSSMHIFQGEGIGEEKMRREQMKETKRDLHAQMDDNERRHMGIKHRDMLTNKELIKYDLKLAEQAVLEEDLRKEARATLDKYNQALAVDHTEKQMEQQRREEQKNLAEKIHILTSDMMTEATLWEGRGGGRPDGWKGLTPEQLSRIHSEREEQCLQRQRQRDAKKFQEALSDLHCLKLSRKAEEEEKRVEDLKREQRIHLDQYNTQLARQQQAQQEFLNKELYTNKPTKDYFSQFNTSSR